MRLSVSHRTTYTYSRPVYLEPHFLRLRPRTDPAQEVLRYRLHISPEPAGRADGLDPEGNWLTCIWYNGLTDRLDLTAEFEAVTRRSNPFDFLLTAPGFSDHVRLYEEDLRERLAGYLRPLGCEETAAFARAIPATGSPVDFLVHLTRAVHERCRVVVREWGDPQPPGQTLTGGTGACRDLALVFMEACRSLGIAARFASGFVGGESGGTDDHTRFLHAWVEVYLPGAGWRGFDPTQGLAVADQHVCVAASSSYRGAAPVSGTLRGTGAVARMETEIQIARV